MVKMNEYIFTCEGYTEPPREGYLVENCQVLGIANGSTPETAKKNLLQECSWIEECGFDIEKIICRRIL